MNKYLKRKKWKEFRESGLLWWINMILHTFGWAITMTLDEEENVIDVYPSRTKYRGFPEESNTKGYKDITNHLHQNIDELKEEVEDG